MADSAYIHTIEDRSYFAIRLERLATLTALGPRPESYPAQLLARQVDWLTCLINAKDEQVTFDLRFISRPDPALYVRGRLAIGLLCRLDGVSVAQAQARAHEMLRLCEAFFEDEYEFKLVAEQEEFESLRNPFTPRVFSELTRRTEIANLDTLRSGTSSLGFTPRAKTSARRSHKRIYHIYPYVGGNAPLALLFKLMLMHPEPLAISFRMKPTTMSDGEIQFLEKQIQWCERFAQAGIKSDVERLSEVYPTLQEQARAFQRLLTKALFTLKDNAALLRVEVAGEDSFPQALTDVLGVALTRAVGVSGQEENLLNFLRGGYEILPVAEADCAALGFAQLDLKTQPDPLAPAAAGRLRYLFDASEAVVAFRFPAPAWEETPGLPAKTSRTQLAAADIPQNGLQIGASHHNGRTQRVCLTPEDRRRHVYAVGQTGTGKTTLFEQMILSGIRAGEGLCVIDPHGDLIEKLLPKIPAHRAEDIVLLDPSDAEYPVGFNVLEYETDAQKNFLIQEMMAIIERLLQKLDPAMGGPIFYQHSRMVLQLVMSDREQQGTLVQFYQVFNQQHFYKRFLTQPISDPMLKSFVEGTLSNMNYLRTDSSGGSMGGYISSKYEPFIGDPVLRNIFGQRRSTINLREIMDSGKILLVNLSKGQMGEISSRFFGMVLVAKLQAAAMSRAALPMEQRRDFYLYVDEFQNLATQNFGILLAEARKYRLNLVLTNQFVAQLPSDIVQAIAGNVGTTISFRVGALDAELMEREFLPTFNRYDLMNLPNFNTYVSTLINGQVSRPFSMQTRPDQTPPNVALGAEIREKSRQRYARSRDDVRQEIADSLEPMTTSPASILDWQ